MLDLGLKSGERASILSTPVLSSHWPKFQSELCHRTVEGLKLSETQVPIRKSRMICLPPGDLGRLNKGAEHPCYRDTCVYNILSNSRSSTLLEDRSLLSASRVALGWNHTEINNSGTRHILRNPNLFIYLRKQLLLSGLSLHEINEEP